MTVLCVCRPAPESNHDRGRSVCGPACAGRASVKAEPGAGAGPAAPQAPAWFMYGSFRQRSTVAVACSSYVVAPVLSRDWRPSRCHYAYESPENGSAETAA